MVTLILTAGCSNETDRGVTVVSSQVALQTNPPPVAQPQLTNPVITQNTNAVAQQPTLSFYQIQSSPDDYFFVRAMIADNAEVQSELKQGATNLVVGSFDQTDVVEISRIVDGINGFTLTVLPSHYTHLNNKTLVTLIGEIDNESVVVNLIRTPRGKWMILKILSIPAPALSP